MPHYRLKLSKTLDQRTPCCLTLTHASPGQEDTVWIVLSKDGLCGGKTLTIRVPANLPRKGRRDSLTLSIQYQDGQVDVPVADIERLSHDEDGSLCPEHRQIESLAQFELAWEHLNRLPAWEGPSGPRATSREGLASVRWSSTPSIGGAPAF
jgi:hypothetical protein